MKFLFFLTFLRLLLFTPKLNKTEYWKFFCIVLTWGCIPCSKMCAGKVEEHPFFLSSIIDSISNKMTWRVVVCRNLSACVMTWWINIFFTISLIWISYISTCGAVIDGIMVLGVKDSIAADYNFCTIYFSYFEKLSKFDPLIPWIGYSI